MATSTARLSGFDDGELASLATAGDGDAFAVLYDRHERRVFGFCARMLGSDDAAADATQETFMRLLVRLPALRGRELNFVAYALTTARNTCYDALAARKRVQPVAETPEPPRPEPGAPELDPERAALLAATREQVRAAHARLSDRQREVLALRELEQLSYEQIGEIVELNANAVAQLISRARLRLRDLVRGGQLEAIATSGPDCLRALPLLAGIHDAQSAPAEELDWLRGHLTACDTCRLSRAAMEEAGASYRALGPIVPVLWLRHATIARAAQLVHADWSAQAGSAPDAGPPGAGGSGPGAAAGAAGGGVDGSAGDASRGGPGGVLRAHRRRRLALLVVITAVIAAALAAGIHPDSRIAAGRTAAHPSAALAGGAAAVAHARRAKARQHPGLATAAFAHPAAAALAPSGAAAEARHANSLGPKHAQRRHPAGHAPAPASSPSGQGAPAPATQTTATPAPRSTRPRRPRRPAPRRPNPRRVRPRPARPGRAPAREAAARSQSPARDARAGPGRRRSPVAARAPAGRSAERQSASCDCSSASSAGSILYVCSGPG